MISSCLRSTHLCRISRKRPSLASLHFSTRNSNPNNHPSKRDEQEGIDSTDKSLEQHNNTLSSSSSETTADGRTIKKQPIGMKLPARSLFPWRHSTDPLPRLIPNTMEFETEGAYMGPGLPEVFPATHQLFRAVMWANGLGFLGSSTYQYFTIHKELEEAFLYSFCVGVQGVLNDTYHMDTESKDDESNVEKEEEEEKEDLQGDNDNEPSIPNKIQFDQIVNPPAPLFDSDSSTTSAGDHTRNIEDFDCSPMLEPHLINLYKSAHEHAKSKLSIQLQSQPHSAKLMNLFAVPFLTREEVQRKPALRHCFRSIVKDIHKQGLERGRRLNAVECFKVGMLSLNEMADKQYARNGEEKMQATVIAQVEIQCDEIFCVKDVDSGKVIQGDADGKVNDVTHLCRFEIVVDICPLSGEIELGHWQITDWDDLLDGNIWFL